MKSRYFITAAAFVVAIASAFTTRESAKKPFSFSYYTKPAANPSQCNLNSCSTTGLFDCVNYSASNPDRTFQSNDGNTQHCFTELRLKRNS